MKKILLTGGSGFIGKNIIESYLADKYDITAPTHPELNLMDNNSVRRFFSHNKIDVVIHTAVKPGHRNSTEQSDILHPNLRMFFNLEQNADKFEKMLFLGSGAVYDNRHYEPNMNEDSYRRNIPADEYGFAKYISTKIIENSRNLYDLRLFGIFGKYEDYAIRFISNALCKSIFNIPITLRQDRKFDYLYVNDLMPVLEYFIDGSPMYHSYNVTPDESVSLLDLAEYIKELTRNPHPIIVKQAGSNTEYSGDNSRLTSEIGSLTFTPVKKAIDQLYEWYSGRKEQLNREFLLIDK